MEMSCDIVRRHICTNLQKATMKMIEPQRDIAFCNIPGKTIATKTALFVRRICGTFETALSEARRAVSYTTAMRDKTGARFAIGSLAMRLFVVATVLLSPTLGGAQEPGAMTEWPYVGAEQGAHQVLGG